MSVSTIEVTSLHSIPVVPLDGSVTLSTVSGDTVYYGQDQTVSASNKTGSLTVGGGSVTLTVQGWIVSAGVSAVQMVSGTPRADGAVTKAEVIATGLAAGDIGAAAGFSPTAVKSAPYTLAAGEYVPVDASGGAVALTLPTAPADKTRVGFKITAQAATPNNVTVTRGGTDVFNKAAGSTTLTFMALNTSVILQYAASTGIWYAQSTDTPLNTASGAAKLGTDGTVGGSGGSALANLAVTDTSADQPGGQRTKRVTMPIGADGSSGLQTSSNYQDQCQRMLVELPVATTRWRLRIANASIITSLANPTFYGGAITVKGVAVGVPAWDANATQWKGDFASAPVGALGTFTTAPPNATQGDTTPYDYVTGWVTDPAAQFQAYSETGVSIGFTSLIGSSDGNGHTYALVSSSYGCVHVQGAIGGGGASAHWNAVSLGVINLSVDLAMLDIRLEYEFLDKLDKHLVVMAVGDSITRGLVPGFEAGLYRGISGGIPVHKSWLGAAGLRNGFCFINLGTGGAQSKDFTGLFSSDWHFNRCDLTTTVPDALIIAVGSNDANPTQNVSVATYKSNVSTLIANARAAGVKRILVVTVLPRNYPWPTTYEADLINTNGATSGVFYVAFTILGQPFTAGPFNWNDSAATVAAQFQAVLPLSMVNSVVGSGGPLNSGPVTVTFQNGAYGPVSDQAIVASSLAGGTTATVTVSRAGAETGETKRTMVNAWLRQGLPFVEGMYDFDQLLRDPSNPQVMSAVYSDQQQVHPWRGGYQRMAEAVVIR